VRPGARRAALVTALVLAAAVVLLRVVLPPRYPVVDGTLRVAADGPGVTATATWATDGPVPERRRDCTTAVLVLPPAGAGDARYAGEAVPLASGAREVRRVLDQYGEVLPPDLPARVAAWALPAVEQGRLEWRWERAADAGAGVRAWVAPVCPETVHGIVELTR
jgi:hypothetical protein